MTITVLSITLSFCIVLCALQASPLLHGNLLAQSPAANSSFDAVKLLTDRAVQGFQSNSIAYSISQLLTAYDLLVKLGSNDGADRIPGGTNGVSFILGDTIKLLTSNSNPAVKNVTISYLNALEEQVTRLLASVDFHSENRSNKNLPNDTLLGYVNTAYGVKIDYPLTWIIRIDSNYSLPSSLTYLHPHVISSFYLPNATQGLPFLYVGVNSNLSKQFKQPHFTTEQYLNKSVESKMNSLSFPKFKLIERLGSDHSNATLDGLPAYKIAWIYNHPQYGLRKIIEFGTVLNGTRGYFLDYAASVSKFSKYLPLVERLKNSFAIIQTTRHYYGPALNQSKSPVNDLEMLTFDCYKSCR